MTVVRKTGRQKFEFGDFFKFYVRQPVSVFNVVFDVNITSHKMFLG